MARRELGHRHSLLEPSKPIRGGFRPRLSRRSSAHHRLRTSETPSTADLTMGYKQVFGGAVDT